MTGEQSEHPPIGDTAGSPPTGGITRKKLLKAAVVAAPAPFLVGALPALAGNRTPSGQSLDPTPYCDDGDDPTPPQMEGPYFKPNSPQRTSMLDGTGTRLVLTGTVYGLACQPIANALLDFWQADANGAYDNTGFRFRGHQYTNSQGAFSLTTIVPGLYPGRTRHIHVKVQAPGRPILTTQLYFPGEPRNATDSLYNPALLMSIQNVGTERRATFDFVLNVNQTPGPTPTSTGTPPPSGTWRAGVSYPVGTQVSYNSLNYRCQIAHTSMVGWEPPNAPALWQRI
ncbi:dioxygenase [Micromonospora polyrhachis]|uniref:Protocatechuate 3,4-dioxygenase beta subunit n=1 Tax=Micromonospora polyrhachis TaxID=1282883 RepID=A0A7W7WTE9_9ACTN|nr:carbohydrate-binding protein [Micromonospora polyrhachis]MBB4962627.1 protocatechuate 3,4-dioxygenase beta subunit [Micromonospora polyrhachis]